jgi:hypothetical protein
MMLSVAAAARRQGRFGLDIEKRDKKRQEENRKQNRGHRPQTETVSARGSGTARVKRRHKPLATGEHTRNPGRRRNARTEIADFGG